MAGAAKTRFGATGRPPVPGGRPDDGLRTLRTGEELRERLTGPNRAVFIRELAEQGVAEAQALYGQLLLDGVEVAKDPRAGFSWFMRAAAQQHLMALNMVGRCYDLGWGVAVDKRRAAECFRVAAERGMPEAMYNYATLLAQGQGVGEDKAAALAWLRRAAANGFAKAENFIGSFHEDGWATSVDLLAAAQCYKRAAAGGDFRGCFNHARMLVAKRRIDEALRWIEAAGKLGHQRFAGQVRGWLEGQRDAELRIRGLAALDRGTAAC